MTTDPDAPAPHAPAIAVTRDGPHRYVARLGDRPGEAELTLHRLAAGQLAASHTYVPPAWRGQGVGEALVARLVVDARAAGLTIVPLCSFVAAQARRHPEWRDVLVGR